jgi:hypothetical protein
MRDGQLSSPAPGDSCFPMRRPCKLIESIAVLACALFYITAVEHPARLSCGTAVAAAPWAPSYKRATIMQASLALIAGLSRLGVNA